LQDPDLFVTHVPFRPASLKNGQEISWSFRRGRKIVRASDMALLDKQALYLHVASQVPMRLRPLFGGDSVSLHVTEDTDDGSIEIRVRRLAPRPKGRSGRRRDLHNVFDVVADAAQSLLYANDNQIAHVEGIRLVNGEVA
jgi:hypothetical protein